METSYERQLQSVVDAVPDHGCLIALVATIDGDQAAALASDVVQLVARERSGHTLLVAIENAPPALDHEIGVEGGPGLTEVLAGTIAVSGVAAHGRARGFIFLPAGESPAPASEVFESRAFHALAGKATRRGGVVFAFVPLDVLTTTSPPAVDGVVWLGPDPPSADVPEGWTTLGALQPPGVKPAARVASAPGPIKISSPRRGPDVRRSTALRRPVVAALLTAAVVLATALTLFGVARSRNSTSFLPENDSLWFPPQQRATPDSTP